VKTFKVKGPRKWFSYFVPFHSLKWFLVVPPKDIFTFKLTFLDIDPHVQLCLGMQVTLVDPINKHKVAISQITRLLSSIIDKKTILPKYVVVMIEEIFTLEAIVHQMIDLGASQLETKLLLSLGLLSSSWSICIMRSVLIRYIKAWNVGLRLIKLNKAWVCSLVFRC